MGVCLFFKRRDKLILSRDKFGEKPLFYYHNIKKGILFFGSNINYIKKLSDKKIDINQDKILNFLRNNFREYFLTILHFIRIFIF